MLISRRTRTTKLEARATNISRLNVPDRWVRLDRCAVHYALRPRLCTVNRRLEKADFRPARFASVRDGLWSRAAGQGWCFLLCRFSDCSSVGLHFQSTSETSVARPAVRDPRLDIAQAIIRPHTLVPRRIAAESNLILNHPFNPEHPVNERTVPTPAKDPCHEQT